MEQKFREAAKRYSAKRTQSSGAVTDGGLAAMAQAQLEREQRRQWITSFAAELLQYLTSSEGAAAMELVRASGERIPFALAECDAVASPFSLSGEGVCENVSSGGSVSFSPLTSHRPLTPELCERVARSVLTDKETPTQVLQRFRARIMALAEQV